MEKNTSKPEKQTSRSQQRLSDAHVHITCACQQQPGRLLNHASRTSATRADTARGAVGGGTPGLWTHLVAAACARLKPAGAAVVGGTPADVALRAAASANAANDLPAAVAAVRRLERRSRELVAD